MSLHILALISLQSLRPHILPVLDVSNGTVNVCMNHLSLKKVRVRHKLTLILKYSHLVGSL